MTTVPVKVKLSHEDAILPKYQTEGAAGFDVHCIEDVRMIPHVTEMVRTGLYFEIPDGYELQVRPRSGLAAKYSVTVVNSPGTIDSDYRGEVCILLSSPRGLDINKGERVAQLVLKEVPRAELIVVDELSDTVRGGGGFGHTGT